MSDISDHPKTNEDVYDRISYVGSQVGELHQSLASTQEIDALREEITALKEMHFTALKAIRHAQSISAWTRLFVFALVVFTALQHFKLV